MARKGTIKATVAKHRALQKQTERAERGKAKPTMDGAMQAGARPYPEPPFPKQHQSKPGEERALDPAPLYDAPFYKGSGKLLGKVAIITGADSGIGRSVAVLFAREGADIAVVYLSEHADANVTKQAVENEGRRCLLIAGDVAKRAFCEEAVKKTVKVFERVDVLVNNAGFQLHQNRIEDLNEKHFDMTVKTNLNGYFFMIQAALPHMSNGSAIVNNGSVPGLRGSKELLDYSMTKGGIHALTKSLAAHLIDRGIRVNAVAPGPVWTPFNAADRKAEDVACFGAHSAMKRPAQPEEIAPAFVFLSSPQCSSYITGEVLPVIGGYG